MSVCELEVFDFQAAFLLKKWLQIQLLSEL